MPFGAISWEELVWELAVSMPAQLISLYLEMCILEIRSTRVFWTVECILIFGLTPFRTLIPPAVRVLIAVVTVIALPVLFSWGSLLHRILVSFFTLLQMMSELPTGLLWTALTGTAYTNEELCRNLPVALAVGSSMTVSCIVFLVLLRLFVDRFVHGSMTETPFSLPAIVVAAQPVALCVGLVATIRYGELDAEFFPMLVEVSVIAVVQIAAVLLLYVSIDQYASKRSADLRAEALQVGVTERVASYAYVARRIEDIACLRHDLRNQMQAALLAGPRTGM